MNAKLEELQASMREAQKQSDVIRAKQQQLKREHQEAKVRVRVCEWLCFTEKSQPEPQLVLFIRPIALPPSLNRHARALTSPCFNLCLRLQQTLTRCEREVGRARHDVETKEQHIREQESASNTHAKQACAHAHMGREGLCVRACVCVCALHSIRCVHFALAQAEAAARLERIQKSEQELKELAASKQEVYLH